MRARSSASIRANARGVTAGASSLRIRWCRGSSVMFKSTPAANPYGRSWMIVPPPSCPGPRSDENVVASAAAARTSVWRLTTQNPTPSGVCSVGSCHQTGASRRSRQKTSCGNPAANRSRSVRSTSAKSTSPGSIPSSSIGPPVPPPGHRPLTNRPVTAGAVTAGLGAGRHRTAALLSAEAVGFEPTVPRGYNGFRDRPIRPLSHASVAEITRVRRAAKNPVRTAEQSSASTPPVTGSSWLSRGSVHRL